jgi:hypothetical protein
MRSDKAFTILGTYNEASYCDVIAIDHIDGFNILKGLEYIFPVPFIFFSIVFDGVKS